MPRDTMRQKYSRLKAEGKLKGTIKAALQKRKARYENTPGKPKRFRLKKHRLPLFITTPDSSVSKQYFDFKDKHSRKQNWAGVIETFDYCDKHPSLVTDNVSSSYKYAWYMYKVAIRSYCHISHDGSYLMYFIGNTAGKLKAPRGWVFGADDLGVYTVRKSRQGADYFTLRYHFSGNEVQTGRVHIQARLHEGRQIEAGKAKRAQEAILRCNKDKLQKIRDTVGVYVTLKDSRDAGNCATGTATWCNQNNIPMKGGVNYQILERFANMDYRVQRAIEQAERRSLIDMERGFCETLYYSDADRKTAADNVRLWLGVVHEESAAC